MRQNFSSYRCAPIYRIGHHLITASTYCLVVVTAAIVLQLGMPNDVSAQVQERPRLLLRDVAKVTLDSSGKSQIAFNPAICRKLGPDLCEYFRAHEYGHVNLRHLERGVPTRQAEHEADIWAARNASPSAVAAAKRYFEQGNGGSRYHGTSQQRAQRISAAQTGRRVTSIEKRTAVVRTPNSRSAANAPSAKKRAPSGYSAGYRTAVISKPSPSRRENVRQVIYVEGSNRGVSRSYVPRGGFNNPSR